MPFKSLYVYVVSLVISDHVVPLSLLIWYPAIPLCKSVVLPLIVALPKSSETTTVISNPTGGVLSATNPLLFALSFNSPDSFTKVPSPNSKIMLPLPVPIVTSTKKLVPLPVADIVLPSIPSPLKLILLLSNVTGSLLL